MNVCPGWHFPRPIQMKDKPRRKRILTQTLTEHMTGTHLLLPVLFQEGVGTCPLTGRSYLKHVTSKMSLQSELPEASDLG